MQYTIASLKYKITLARPEVKCRKEERKKIFEKKCQNIQIVSVLSQLIEKKTYSHKLILCSIKVSHTKHLNRHNGIFIFLGDLFF